MFQFTGFASDWLYIHQKDIEVLPSMGCPIREFPDQRLLAAPRDLSQLTTPFVASLRQGIHHVPLVA
jgi:hypothetical protein